MTSKHLNALANALYAAHPNRVDFPRSSFRSIEPSEDLVDVFMSAVDAVADVCEAANPKFDRAYFMARVVQGPKAKRQREV